VNKLHKSNAVSNVTDTRSLITLTASFYLPVVSNVGCDGRHQAMCSIFQIEPVSQRKDLKVLATIFKGKKKNKQMHRRHHSSHIPHKPCNTHFSRLESTFQRRT